jgi:hypothetical protein
MQAELRQNSFLTQQWRKRVLQKQEWRKLLLIRAPAKSFVLCVLSAPFFFPKKGMLHHNDV